MSGFDAAYEAIQQKSDALKNIAGQEQAEMKPIIASAQQEAAKPLPQPPAAANMPTPPKGLNYGTDLGNWVTALTVMSGVVGALSRQHATTALNAFSAGIKGYKEGNEQAFNTAYKEWEAASKSAIDSANQLQTKYKNVLDNRKLSLDEKEVQLKLIAAEHKDQLVYTAADMKDWITLGHTIESQEQAIAKLQSQQDKMTKPTLSDEAINTFADAIAKGVSPNSLGLGWGMNANKAAVMNRLAETHPNLDLASIEAGYGTVKQEARTVGANAGRIELAANSLSRMIPIAKQAVKNLDLSNVTDINQLENYMRTHTGDPNIESLKTALQAIISDHAALMVRGGQPTVESRNAVREMINENLAEGQFDAYFNMVEREKAAQLAAIQDTKKQLLQQPSAEPAAGAATPPADSGEWKIEPIKE